MIYAILIGLIISYVLRKLMVSDMCVVYLTKKMSDQWKQIIQTIGIGKAILSNSDSPSLLYYNPALKEFMEILYPETHRDN